MDIQMFIAKNSQGYKIVVCLPRRMILGVMRELVQFSLLSYPNCSPTDKLAYPTDVWYNLRTHTIRC